jgi:hypothetical protein
MGVNQAGHVLGVSSVFGPFPAATCFGQVWVWDGSDFHLFPPAPDPPPGYAPSWQTLGGVLRLTDSGQALLGAYLPIFPYPERAGIYDTATTSFTYLPMPASFGLIATRGLELNSRGQVLAQTTEAPARLLLWNDIQGQPVDLGSSLASNLNNAGQILLLDPVGSTLVPRFYDDGAISTPTFPPEAQLESGVLLRRVLLNDFAQIVTTPPTMRAVLLTPGPSMTSFTAPILLTGCKSGKGVIQLDRPAPDGGVLVSLESSSAVVNVPSSLKFKAGASKKSFSIKTSPVTSPQSVTVTATLGGQSFDRSILVRPIGVASISLTPTPVQGGTPVTATITLECQAGPGDVVVSVSSSLPAVAAPATSEIAIAAGSVSGAVTVNTTAVTAVKKPLISASVPDGQGKKKRLVVNP